VRTLMLCLALLVGFQDADRVATRFGDLTVDPDGKLLFKEAPLNPAIEANDHLELGQSFQIGANDVVLVRNFGGSGCPVSLHFVTVTAAGATATPEFGTCTDIFTVERRGDSVVVSMHGFVGRGVSPRDERKAVAERHTFVYRNGAVTENGRPSR
jgi:hypothetical protein